MRPAPAQPREHRDSLLAQLVGTREDEAYAPQHYRINAIWRVLAVNAGQAVVECVTGYDKGRRQTWSIAHHVWFEASDLLEALEPSARKMVADDLSS